MKIKKKIWTVVICDYDAGNFNDLYVNSDMYMDEEKAREGYENTKKYLMGLAGYPEPENGSFPGKKFVVKTGDDVYLPDENRTRCTVERVTDVAEERYYGEAQLVCEEVEIDVPLSAEIAADGCIRVCVRP